MTDRCTARLSRPYIARHHAAWAALALLLAVSGARADPVTGPLTVQIINWPAGTMNEVRLRVAYFAQNADAKLGTVIATAPVDAQGRFSLPLPSSAGIAALLPAASATYTFQNTCKGQVTASPAGRVNFFTLDAYQDGVLLSTVKLDSFDGIAALAFASVPTTLSGAVTCTKDSLQTWTAPLVAGWNLLWQEDGEERDGVWQISVSAESVPQDAFWHLYEGYVGIGMRMDFSLDKSAVLVDNVVPGGPAETAGLKVGDQLVAVDGFQLKNVTPENGMDVTRRVRGDVGKPVTLTIKRGTQTFTLKIVRQFIRN
ncbi:PDZ domain-containing protein [Deinococcus marmoris]|uniref:PDZ domain-containing protein n=1 Tax=Deinococcus marmoris TaxID=249408 RepID=UPI000497D272|nr:PDZ domain-containing protein [Deinococcus marmoris]